MRKTASISLLFFSLLTSFYDHALAARTATAKIPEALTCERIFQNAQPSLVRSQALLPNPEKNYIGKLVQTIEVESAGRPDVYAKLVSNTIGGGKLSPGNLRPFVDRVFTESQDVRFSSDDQNKIWDSLKGNGTLERAYGHRAWGTTEALPGAEAKLRKYLISLDFFLESRGENPGFSFRKGQLLDSYLLKLSGLDKKPYDPSTLKSYARLLYVILSEHRFSNADVLRPTLSGTYESVLKLLPEKDRERLLAGMELQRQMAQKAAVKAESHPVPADASVSTPRTLEEAQRQFSTEAQAQHQDHDNAFVGKKLSDLIERMANGDRQLFLAFLAIAVRENRVPKGPVAREAYKNNVILSAQELKFPANQMDFIRRLTSAQKDVAVELLEAAGL